MSEQFPEPARGGGVPDPAEAYRLAEEARRRASAGQPSGQAPGLGQPPADAPTGWYAPGTQPRQQGSGPQPPWQGSGPQPPWQGSDLQPPWQGNGPQPNWQGTAAHAPQPGSSQQQGSSPQGSGWQPNWQGQQSGQNAAFPGPAGAPASFPGAAQGLGTSGWGTPPGQPAPGAYPSASHPGNPYSPNPYAPNAYPPGQASMYPSPMVARRRHGLLRVLLPVGAVLLVLALVLGAMTRRSSSPQRASSVSESASPSATSTASASPSASPTPSVDVSGAQGQAAVVLSHLAELGFTCSDEGLSLYVSRFCTHFKDDPPLSAYVAADADGTVHRLTLYTSEPDATRSAATLALQHQLIQWMVPAADVARVETAVRAGHSDKYATTTAGSVEASGSGNGSVVLKTKGWKPAMDLPTLPLLDNRVPLAATLKKAGFTCTDTGSTACQHTDGATKVKQMVTYWGEDNDPSWMLVQVTGPTPDAAHKSYDALTATLFPLFVNSADLVAFSQQHSHEVSGASEFHDHVLLESWGGDNQVVFHVGSACWADLNPNC